LSTTVCWQIRSMNENIIPVSDLNTILECF
jgi:hypothetical protein